MSARHESSAPGPLDELRARTHDAIEDLAAIHSHDPAANGAMQAVRLTAHTLQDFWVPALDAATGREPGGG